MASTIEVEQQDLSYSQLLFRHIDRIQNMLTGGHNDDIVLRYSMGVQALISMIPDSLRSDRTLKEDDATFDVKLQSIIKRRDALLVNQKKYDRRIDFTLIQEMFNLAINLFAVKGYLYKKYSTGMPHEK